MPEDSEAPAAGEAAGAQEAAAEARLGGYAADRIQNKAHGSYDADDPDRPRWVVGTQVEREYDYRHEDGRYAYTVNKGRRPDGEKVFLTGRRTAGSFGDLDLERRDDPRGFYSHPGLTHYRIGKGDEPDLLYKLPELMDVPRSEPVFLPEGEKDVETLLAVGLNATTNPNGALSWREEYNAPLAGRPVVVLIDKDDKGRQRRAVLRRALLGAAASLKIVELPGLPTNGDVTDWLDAGHTVDDLLKVVEATPDATPGDDLTRGGDGVQLTDFYAFMPSHNYIFAPSGEPWPSTSVNSRIAPVAMIDERGQPVLDDDGEQRFVAANKWLDQHRPVEQMTWAPGEPQVVRGRLISDGGWFARGGCNVFNLYRPPIPQVGDAGEAGPWLQHVRRVYPEDAEHILDWLAHRAQRPQEKINHAIVMGGAQGIGKDTILEPVKAAIGAWNFLEVSPKQMLGRFNGFVKSVILRVSEARDLGDIDRFAFYDHLKVYTAAPPDVLRVDEKFMREHSVFNVCGVIITSNNKTNGIYLPEDDRRHFVAWSELTKDAFASDYWQRLWGWYRDGGIGHVAAYLAERDISAFDAKAPPPKTEAFWDIVASNSAPEEAELTDALDKLGNPAAVTLAALAEASEPSFRDWLKDRKNNRMIPHKMEECGYRPVRNPTAKAGRWKVEGKDAVIYARKELSTRDAITAAEKRAREGNNVVPF